MTGDIKKQTVKEIARAYASLILSNSYRDDMLEFLTLSQKKVFEKEIQDISIRITKGISPNILNSIVKLLHNNTNI